MRAIGVHVRHPNKIDFLCYQSKAHNQNVGQKMFNLIINEAINYQKHKFVN
jgi:hypothetical protein